MTTIEDKNLNRVAEFHAAFGHPINECPQLGEFKLAKLRLDLLREELGELAGAVLAEDSVEILDALCDLQYVLDGAFLALGFHQLKEAGMAEVHRSNMSKLGEDGKPIYREDGKVMKGPNYSPPDLRAVFRKHGGEAF